uniref:Uncharacterized protein n=1 Tax=Setaria viridis TaxID=4556 RepID=A0A4U6UZM7_SETVI|nr:hypothetical protein SEVIR_4G212301v2 [Setaria viridis]
MDSQMVVATLQADRDRAREDLTVVTGELEQFHNIAMVACEALQPPSRSSNTLGHLSSLPDRVQSAIHSAYFLGAHTTLSMAASYYGKLDLAALVGGFAPILEVELLSIESEVTPCTQALTERIPPELELGKEVKKN